jgi:manganese oxidase
MPHWRQAGQGFIRAELLRKPEIVRKRGKKGTPSPILITADGMAGTIAGIGDTIKVVFKNNGSHPFSMHPHGVLYAKDFEGSDYNDRTSGADKEDGCVAPGAVHTYTWRVPDRTGPGPNDPSSVFWLYHSHCDELRDVASGLLGGIVIARRGDALPDGRPKDIDHEFVTIFIAINENESW